MAWSTSPDVQPASTPAVLLAGSTRMPLMAETTTAPRHSALLVEERPQDREVWRDLSKPGPPHSVKLYGNS